MAALKRLWRRLFGRRSFERGMAEELRFHVEKRAQDLARDGVPEDEARRRARVEFGGMESWKEQCREAGGYRPFDELRGDIHYGLRALRGSPGFAFVAVLSLAIGIGANTAIFSLLDGASLRPMPVPRNREIVRVFSNTPQQGDGDLSWPEYQEMARQVHSFNGLVACGHRGVQIARPDGTLELFNVYVVSMNFFRVMGVQAVRGRVFTPQDEASLDRQPVVVLGHDFWMRRFGGDPTIVGRPIRLDRADRAGLLATVLGVLPAGFRDPEPGMVRDLWLPPQTWIALHGRDDFEDRQFRWFELMGRLRGGVPVATARAEVNTIAGRLAAAWSASNAGRGATAISDLDYRLRAAGISALICLGVVLLVMLLCAVNVANLLLARAAARTRELSIRLAIGAGRARIARQMLTESVLLGTAGLAAGLVLGAVIIRAIPSLIMAPPGFRQFMLFQLDSRVLLFGAAVAAITTLLFGMAPALQATRTDLNESLKQGRGAPAKAGRRFRIRQWLVVAQVALSLTLLAVAAVLTQSFVNTRTANLGMARRELLLLWTEAPDELYRPALERLQALPGVNDIAFATRAPLSLSSNLMARRVTFPDRPELRNAPPVEILYNAVSSNFLRVMGTPLLRGRDFDERDQSSGPPVVLVNEQMAARYWPNEDAVGRIIRIGDLPGVEHRIVGVVKNAPVNEIGEIPQPYLYLPYWRVSTGELTFMVYTKGPAVALATAARRALVTLDRRLDPFTVVTEEDLIRFSALQYQLTAELLGTLSLIGLSLTAVGLYGVVSFGVARRTREIGIRMALGAARRETLGLILRETAALGAVGVAIGVPLALAGTRLARSMLFGVGPWDPRLFVIAMVVLAAVLLAAGAIPARRATRIDPMSALRAE